MNIRVLLISLAILFGGIGIVMAYGAYAYYDAIHADDPVDPSFHIEVGSGKIIRWDTAIDLSTGESYVLEWADIVETEKESKATILWPDRSITRMGANTRIIIQKMEVSKNYDTIQVSYDIKRGKVWNTVIRLLVGDSYFDVHLPKESIIAGVRGTTFEVNLDNLYIHAVDHTTHLTDKSGKSIDLLPGQLVSSENIWLQRGREWIDTTWQDWNTVSDSTYSALRSLHLESRLELLSGKSQPYFSLGGLTSKVLSHVNGYESINITKYLDSGNREKLQNYSEATLLEYYQKASWVGNIENRDIIRTVILEKIEGNIRLASLRTLLENASIWESIDTGKILPSAKSILWEGVINLKNILEVWSQSIHNPLLESLSWALREILH